MSAERPRQLTLPVGAPGAPALAAADFLVDGSNRAAYAALAGGAPWAGPALALVGPEGAGKSHLAAVWASRVGARMLDAADIVAEGADALAARPIVLDPADRAAGAGAEAERALLHLHNLMVARGHPFLLTGRAAPARWAVALPDLASRLAALPLLAIGPPEDRLLAALLIKLAKDRQIRLDPPVVRRLVSGMERSHAGVARVVDALDRVSLTERRRITVQLAGEVLAGLEDS